MVSRGRFTNRVAIVTGGARGLGAAIANGLSAEGASVLIVDLRDELGEDMAGSLDQAHYLHANVANEEDWQHIIETCRAAFGPPDVLISNASYATTATVEDETLEGWNSTLAVCLTAGFLGIRAVIPEMRTRGGGAIVTISSTHGGNVAIPIQAAYQAAKGGLTALTRNAAVTYAADGIRANAIHPGPIRTPLIEESGLVEEQARIAHTLPLGRVATPEEIAAAALYLASDDAAYITGTALVIDGGYTAL